MITAFLVLGVVLRVLMLVWPTSYWGDEWASIEFSKGTMWQTIAANAYDTHPPLYFMLLNIAYQFLDIGRWVLRVPSLVLGIGTLFAAHLLGRELLDRRTHRIFIWFAAIAPSLVTYSHMVRNHGSMAFYCALAAWCVLRMDKEPERKAWRALFIASALGAVYTQHMAWIWLGALFVYRPRRVYGWVVLGALPMLWLVAVNLLHYDRHYDWVLFQEMDPLRYLYKTVLVHFRYVIGQQRFHAFVDPPALFLFLTNLAEANYKKMIFVLWAGLSIGGLCLLVRRIGWRRPAIFCVPSLLVFVIGSGHNMYFESRYFSFLAVPTLMLLAYGITSLFRRPVLQLALVLIFSFIMLPKTLLLVDTHASIRFDEDHWRSLERVHSQSQPGDIIANVDDEQYAFNRRWLPEPEGVRWIEDAMAAPISEMLSAPRVWVLGTDTLGPRLEAAGLKKVRPYHLRREYVALYFNPQAARTAEET